MHTKSLLPGLYYISIQIRLALNFKYIRFSGNKEFLHDDNLLKISNILFLIPEYFFTLSLKKYIPGMYKQQHATHLRTPLQPITVFYGALPYIIEVIVFAQTYRYRIRRK